MSERNTLIDVLLDRASIGYVSIDAELQVLEASSSIKRFGGGKARALVGRPLTDAFPEFTEYYDRLRRLARDGEDTPLRFRVHHDNNTYFMVSAMPVAEEAARVLILFEDITLLVLRTEVLGRRVMDLEARCQYLERLIAEHRDAVASEGFKRHFDPGSGLYDFEFVITRLVDEVTAARRWGRPLSVAVLRLEALARRRRGGGLSGGDLDAALRECAGIVRRRLRSMDTVGRLDETGVVIILPNVDKDGAWVPVERLRALLAEQSMLGPDVADIRSGIAELEPEAGDTALAVFERARQDL